MKAKGHHITTKSAAAILEHYYHARPESIAQIHGGLENYVFEAKLRGKELIVRIASKPNRLQFFLKEQWAVRKARESGVPVPEILEVGNELDGMPYMILEKISGQPADMCVDRLRTLRSLATHTRTINSISTSGFGHVFDWSRNRLSRTTKRGPISLKTNWGSAIASSCFANTKSSRARNCGGWNQRSETSGN